MGASRFVTVNVDKILRETDKAFLVEIDGDEVWLPFSQVADFNDYAEGDEDLELSVTEWIANEKGLP
jgi:hypothetical protein